MATNDKPQPQKATKKKSAKSQPAGRTGADVVLIAALAGGAKLEDAAVQASVSVSTIMRRLRSPAFRDRVERAREDFLNQAMGLLAQASVRASTVISDLMQSADAESVRLAAARVTLEMVIKMRDHIALVDRMRAIEQHLGTASTPPPPARAVEPDNLGDE